MRIYKLTINEIAADPGFAVISSYKAPRTERKVEYFLTQELAQQRAQIIYDSFNNLLGFVPKVEVIVDPIEVKEDLNVY